MDPFDGVLSHRCVQHQTAKMSISKRVIVETMHIMQIIKRQLIHEYNSLLNN